MMHSCTQILTRNERCPNRDITKNSQETGKAIAITASQSGADSFAENDIKRTARIISKHTKCGLCCLIIIITWPERLAFVLLLEHDVTGIQA